MKIPALKRDLEKAIFLSEKVTLQIFRFGAKSDPKRHPKIMKTSTPNKYPKMMPKGLKRDGKWSQHGSQIHENPYKNRFRKRMQKKH